MTPVLSSQCMGKVQNKIQLLNKLKEIQYLFQVLKNIKADPVLPYGNTLSDIFSETRSFVLEPALQTGILTHPGLLLSCKSSPCSPLEHLPPWISAPNSRRPHLYSGFSFPWLS